MQEQEQVSVEMLEKEIRCVIARNRTVAFLEWLLAHALQYEQLTHKPR